MTIVNLQPTSGEASLVDDNYLADYPVEMSSVPVQSLALAISHPNPTTQLLLSSRLIPHRPEAGLNPVVDAAAYVFSMMGKLKHIKNYHSLAELQKELIQSIVNFQESIKAYSHNAEYISEYLPITTYALCVTLDDIISNTAWGGQGRWDEYSLVVAFNQKALSQKSFFIILERLVRDPAIYIDIMEFMYMCLSLGFTCNYNSNSSELDRDQLEQITNTLYKRIRAYRGNFSKTLSPYSLKAHTPMPQPSPWKDATVWMVIFLVSSFLVALFAGAVYLLGGIYLLNSAFNQNQTQPQNSVTYEIRNWLLK